jgi:hypothetical protein
LIDEFVDDVLELVELEPNRDALVSGDTGWDMRHVPCPKCSMLLWMLSY